MSTQNTSRTGKDAALEGAVRGAVDEMRETLAQLVTVVLHEDPNRTQMQTLGDAMKVMFTQAKKLGATCLGEQVRWPDQLDAKLLHRVKLQYTVHHVRDDLVAEMQGEVKELRRRLASSEEGGKSLVELEKAEREQLTAQECQHISDEVIASSGCASTADIHSSPMLQKAVRGGGKVAAVSLLHHMHGRITGSYVCVPETEVVDVDARISDLKHKILQHHEEVKLKADNLRISLADTEKSNSVLKENLEMCQKQFKELQERMDDYKKRGEMPSEDSH